MTKPKLRPPAVVEIIFDILYLCFALVAGVYLLLQASGRPTVLLAGTLALTLGGGDAVHLLPRVYCLYTGTMKENYRLLGLGKLITSITMTLFYVMLYLLGRMLTGEPPLAQLGGLLLLAGLRILLCCLPQNRWFSPNPSQSWGILRNLPFLLLGLVVMLQYGLLALNAVWWQENSGFVWMWLAILLSFAFYIPVVLWADKKPAVGALMLPKTCIYVWMICMTFSLL